MLVILSAVIAYITWGVGSLFEAIGARKIDAKSFPFWGCIIGLVMSSFYAPFAVGELSQITLPMIVLCYVIFGFMYAGSIFYYEAFKKGNPALVGTIGSSFPLVSVVFSLIFLRERLTIYQGTAIGFIFIGLLLSTLNFSQLKLKKIVFNEGVLFALCTMFLWGAYSVLIKIPVSIMGWFWPNVFIFSGFPLIYLYIKLTKSKLEIPTKRNVFIPVILATFFVRIAEFAYNYGISKGMVAVVAPIAGANPTLFVILAYFVFKEPLKKSQILGIIITLTGVVLLSFISG